MMYRDVPWVGIPPPRTHLRRKSAVKLPEPVKRELQRIPLGAITIRDASGDVHLLAKLPGDEIEQLKGPAPWLPLQPWPWRERPTSTR